jgi:hypothetical protein
MEYMAKKLDWKRQRHEAKMASYHASSSAPQAPPSVPQSSSVLQTVPTVSNLPLPQPTSYFSTGYPNENIFLSSFLNNY